MTNQEFFATLDARIAKYDLLCHPFYKAWSAGELTREDLREYGQEYFAHVEAFPSYLAAFASRLPECQLRSVVLANRDDEMGVGALSSHAELWLDFVEGMGGGKDADGKHSTEGMRELANWFESIANHGAQEEALAAFYAYESQVPRVAGEKDRGLGELYRADEKTRGYFALHTTADVYHSRAWRNQLAKLVENNPAAATRALTAAENTAKKLWAALDGIEAARMSRTAVSN